jgi:hypothetical protein
VDLFEELARGRAGYGQGVGQNTHGEFAARNDAEVWHGQAVGQESLGAGIAAAMIEERAEGAASPWVADQPNTYAHVNSMPEDPALLAQLSATNRKFRLMKLGARHEVLARLVATGASDAEMSRVVGRYSQTRLSTIRNSPRFIMRVQQIQEQYFGKGIEGRFKRIGLKAVDTAENILDDRNATGDLRFKAAKDMMDRAFGKAKETVELRTNTVSEMFLAMDRFKHARMDGVAQSPWVEPFPGEAETAEAIPTSSSGPGMPIPVDGSETLPGTPITARAEVGVPTPSALPRDLDSWIAAVVPAATGIGTGGARGA